MVQNIAAMVVVPATTAAGKAADMVVTADKSQDAVLLPKLRNVPLIQAKRSRFRLRARLRKKRA